MDHDRVIYRGGGYGLAFSNRSKNDRVPHPKNFEEIGGKLYPSGNRQLLFRGGPCRATNLRVWEKCRRRANKQGFQGSNRSLKSNDKF